MCNIHYFFYWRWVNSDRSVKYTRLTEDPTNSRQISGERPCDIEKSTEVAFKRNWINLFHIKKIRYGEKFAQTTQCYGRVMWKYALKKLLVLLFVKKKEKKQFLLFAKFEVNRKKDMLTFERHVSSNLCITKELLRTVEISKFMISFALAKIKRMKFQIGQHKPILDTVFHKRYSWILKSRKKQ